MPGDTFQMVKFSLLKTPSFTSESWRSGLELQLEIARETTLHLFLQQRPLVPWNFSSYMASWTYCRIFSCIPSAEYMPPKTNRPAITRPLLQMAYARMLQHHWTQISPTGQVPAISIVLSPTVLRTHFPPRIPEFWHCWNSNRATG